MTLPTFGNGGSTVVDSVVHYEAYHAMAAIVEYSYVIAVLKSSFRTFFTIEVNHRFGVDFAQGSHFIKSGMYTPFGVKRAQCQRIFFDERILEPSFGRRLEMR